MYPRGQLSELETRKALLQARIAVRRWECAAAAAEIARPIAFIDRGVALWKRVSPLVKALVIPGGIFIAQWFKRKDAGAAARKSGKLAAVLGALPMIMQGWKLVQEMRAARREAAEPAGARAGPAESRAGV